MANIKYLVKNLSPNIVLLSYQNSNDNMWNYQVVLKPGQTKNIWCVEGTLSHSGRNSDVSITIDTNTCTPITSPTPIVGDSNPLVLEPIYYPGSIGVIYTLKSKYPSDTDITVSFTNILGTNDIGVITINSSVTIFIGETSGSTQVIIDGDIKTLNDSSLFSDVIVTTDGPSQYFNTPVSAPPIIIRPIDPVPIFEDVYLVTSCCYSGVTGYMQLSTSRFTPDWTGYVVVDSNGDCYLVDIIVETSPTLIYGGRYYKDCKTCISRYPCDIILPTPTPTPTITANPCDVTPTPTPTVSKACPTNQPVINTVFNTTGDTFVVYFTTQGCCSSLTLSWSSDNINWNNSTAGCSSPRTITIPNSSTYPILYFRITQICGGCNNINSNVLTYSIITPTPTPTPGTTPTVTPTISLTPSKTPTNTPTKTPTNTPTVTPLKYGAFLVQFCCSDKTGIMLLPTTFQIGDVVLTTGEECVTIIGKAPKGSIPSLSWSEPTKFENCEQCIEQFPCNVTPTPTPTPTITPTLTLDYTPCLEITSECGTQFAYAGEIINGHISYTLISGLGYPVLIYWDGGYWIVLNTETGDKCSILKGDTQYPIGTSSEWESSVPPIKGCECLASDTGFNTVLSFCPTPTPTPTQTLTPTPAVCEGNLITNGNFDTSLSGWSQSISNNWEWSDYFGGSAHYIGMDEQGTLFQDILTEGATYNVTFTLYNYAPCTEFGYVNVFAGDTTFGPITDTGVTYQNITIICGNGTNFGINAFDACGEGTTGTIYVDNICITEIAGPTPTPTATIGSTPTPTPTNTVTPTVTPTGTATGCIDCGLSGYSYIISNGGVSQNCSIIYNKIEGLIDNIYSYDINTNVSTFLQTGYPSFSGGSPDIAHTSTKLWVYRPGPASGTPITQIAEYNINLVPYTSNFNRIITVNSFLGNGLCAIDDTRLISSTRPSTSQSIVTIIKITLNPNNTGTVENLFTLPSGRQISGDIIYTTNGKIILTTIRIVNNVINYWISQYALINNVWVLEVDRDISSIAPGGNGLAMSGGNILIFSGQFIRRIDTNFPYSVTPVWDTGAIGIGGASQIPSCYTVTFIPLQQ